MNQVESLYSPSPAFHHTQAHPQQPPFYPGAPAPSPSAATSQQPFFPAQYTHGNPQARFQAQQQQAANGFGNATPGYNGTGRGVTQPGFPQFMNQNNTYTSAPYSQPVPTTAGTPSQHASRQAFSPPAQLKVQSLSPQPPRLPQAQASPKTPIKPSTSQPQSPHAGDHGADLEAKIGLLLEINVELLQEVQRLQAQGKGGAQNPQQAQLLRDQGLPDKAASEEFIQTLQRLHANLGYLCGQSDLHHKPGQEPPHPPSFMRPPPNMPGLQDKYAELRRLFPNWPGRDRPGGMDRGSGAAA